MYCHNRIKVGIRGDIPYHTSDGRVLKSAVGTRRCRGSGMDANNMSRDMEFDDMMRQLSSPKGRG
jgi:hypothetical protein